MGGGISPLYKEPFVTLIGIGSVGYFAVYVSGGSVKVLRDYYTGQSLEDAGFWYSRSGADDLEYIPYDDITSGPVKSILQVLRQLYGEISALDGTDDSYIEIMGRRFEYDSISLLEGDYFNKGGLCEGITTILDENAENILASGVFCNGLFHLFGFVGSGGLEYAMTQIGLVGGLMEYPSLRETLIHPSDYWNGRNGDFTKDEVITLLTSRGLRVVWHSNTYEASAVSGALFLNMEVSVSDIYK